MTALLGKKIGITQIFNDAGSFVPVTAIEAGPCTVLALKDKCIQLGFGQVKSERLKKPLAGYFKKLNLAPCRIIREFPRQENREYKVGEDLKADIFTVGDFVDITGISKGKGFQGGMKRWNWHGGPQTHGSTSHRRIGSLGSSTTPGRVWKGHHLPGQMGSCRVTVQNLRVVRVEQENNLILVQGAVPGGKDSYLIIRKSVKKQVAAKNKTETKEKA